VVSNQFGLGSLEFPFSGLKFRNGDTMEVGVELAKVRPARYLSKSSSLIILGHVASKFIHLCIVSVSGL